MSAILGLLLRDGRTIDPSDLERMLASMPHRGTDGAGIWSDAAVGLGHRMLWTTPESREEQLPLHRSQPNLTITADARIDNRQELIRALGLTGIPDSQITDSQLILAAYEQWGENCGERLIGDFAFAIWDGRQRKLFCARDPMGVKPFYYYHSPRLFVFGSELKALFCLPEVPQRLNERMVARYLCRRLDDPAITFYDQIWRVPAGHCLTVDPQQLRLRSYWQPELAREIHFKTDAEYAEALREQFTEAVRCRLRSSYPVGSLLSGGLDSSSIALTAQKLMREEGKPPLHTFSAIFPDLPPKELKRIDERRYIDAVAAQAEIQAQRADVGPVSPLLDLDRVLWHADEAVMAPNMYINWILYARVQEAGVRVLLDGIDGDSTVSHGYERLPALARTGRWNTLLREVTVLSQRLGTPRRGLLVHYAVRPLLPVRVNACWDRWRSGPSSGDSVASLLDTRFARRIGFSDDSDMPETSGPLTARGVRQQHWQGLNSGLFTYVLELVDKAAGAFGFEPRFPFFDRRVIELCLRIPPSQRLRDGWPRSVLRRAMDGILPPEVQWRMSKANLGINFTRRLLEYERSTLEQVVHAPSSALSQFVDREALRAIHQRYLSDHTSRDQDAFTLYRVVVLDHWLQRSGLTASS